MISQKRKVIDMSIAKKRPGQLMVTCLFCDRGTYNKDQICYACTRRTFKTAADEPMDDEELGEFTRDDEMIQEIDDFMKDLMS